MEASVKSPLRRAARSIWRWSWLITLPCSAILLVWGEATASRYLSFGLRYKIYNDPPDLLYKFGRMELDHLVRQVQLTVRSSPERTDSLRRIELFVDESNRRKLDSRLPHSGRDYVDAWLVYPDGEPRRVEMKYRGDFWYHWAYFKKSIRIKTKKKDLFEGLRTFNLIAPKFPSQLNNYLAYKLAEDMGLLTPRHDLVELWINGHRAGLHLFVEQLDESTLRYRRRMPGDLYSGELVARDRYLGIRNALFVHPRLWEKTAVNNHYPAESYAPLEALADAMSRGRAQPCGALGKILEAETWGRFFAYETLLQTFHYLNTHNWRLYYDPARSVLEPVVWDPDGWHPAWIPKPGQKARADIRPSELHDAVLTDHRFLLARQLALESFFVSGQDRRFLREVDRAIQRASLAVQDDPNLVFSFETVPPEEAIEAMRRLRADVARIFADLREAYLGPAEPLEYLPGATPQDLELKVLGRRPVRGLRLEYSRPLTNDIAVRLRYRVSGRSEDVDVSGRASLRGAAVIVDLPLLASFVPTEPGAGTAQSKNLRIDPGHYVLSITGAPPADQIVNLYYHHGEGTEYIARRAPSLRRASFMDNDFMDNEPSVCAVPVASPEIWEGEVVIRGIHTVEKDLVIRPGTTIRLEEGASLIVDGQLSARGTKERPIRFLPALERQEAWGAVVIRGSAANGSTLEHCEFAKGSGYKSELFEYSAMLSIHAVREVSISSCYFHDSLIVDDMVHAVYSSVEIKDSVFVNALYDAIDLDISEAVVDRCTFKSSGNDALDLMTSRVTVANTQFLNAGDKGISVGERTVLFAVNNRFEANNIGVESKDDSTAYVYNSSFTNHPLALNAYNKNWRYGTGGTIYLGHSAVLGEGVAAAADKRSQIHLLDSSLPEGTRASKRVFLAEGAAARQRLAIPTLARGYSALVDPARRGWRADAN